MASPSATPRHVLAAIDGTGSAEWRRPDGRNSHVHGFWRDFEVPPRQKRYFDGPDLLGLEVTRIAERVLNWILEACDRSGPALPQLQAERIGLFTVRPRLVVAPLEAHLDAHAEPSERGIDDLDAPGATTIVSLVGHSRGGLIAILVARSLARHGLRVRFLGLYDAVDMELRHEAQRIENVDFTCHAMRSPAMNSRSLWGNTGTKSAGELERQQFMTSHGGIGGDPTLQPSSFGDDYSCNTRGLTAGIMKAMGSDMEKMCRDNGRRADEWIRENAKRHGLPLR